MSSIRVEIHGTIGGHKLVKFFIDDIMVLEQHIAEGQSMSHDIGRFGANTYELVVTEMEFK